MLKFTLVESKVLQSLILKHRARIEILDNENPVEPPAGETGVRDREERFYEMLRSLCDYEILLDDGLDAARDPHDIVVATLAMVNRALAANTKQIVWALDSEDFERGASRFYFHGSVREVILRIDHMLSTIC
jgi:hypothetical protein